MLSCEQIEIMRFGKDATEMMSRLSRASHQGHVMSGCVITGNVNPGHLVQMVSCSGVNLSFFPL